MFFLLCCCSLGPPFYVLLVFVGMCSVFWLLWLSCQYLPSDWLEDSWGSLTVARWSSPRSPGWRVFMIALVYGILSLFNCMICSSCLPAIRDILHTPMAQYSVFVLKVPLNTKQANKQTNSDPWPVWLQTYGYLPSRKASPPIGYYQIILLGDRGTRMSSVPLECS